MDAIHKIGRLLVMGALVVAPLFSTAASLAAGPAATVTATATNTAFTYQGKLSQNGAPVNGACGFAFKLFDDVTAGNQFGNTLTQNLTVTNGAFATQLDFGNQFPGAARWLEIAVACKGGGFVTLTPRQALSAVPYALSLAPGATLSDSLDTPLLTVHNAAGTALNLQSAGGDGLFAETPSDHSGVAGINDGNGAGIFGQSANGKGVWGASNSNDGVFGQSAGADRAGVSGVNTGGGLGVYGVGDNVGVKGVSGPGDGIVGHSDGGDGVFGESSQAGRSGVAGVNHGGGNGLYGASESGIGVRGVAKADDGVFGETNQGGRSGVAGVNHGPGNGLYGRSEGGGPAVYVDGYAAQPGNGGGLVKAMLYVDYTKSQPLVRCFNGQARGAAVNALPCGFKVVQSSLGYWLIDFGFDVAQRFVSVTPGFEFDSTCGVNPFCHGSRHAMGASVLFHDDLPSFLTPNQIEVVTQYADSGDPTNLRFFIVVY
ncbi:MAG: hypothetical protein U0350_43160 [Caldilineaceae bacterium]